MLWLTRFTLNNSRISISWAANSYRIHQRLMMVYEGEPRLLFRVEEAGPQFLILAQSHIPPDWKKAFENFNVLAQPPEYKSFQFSFAPEAIFRFRLLANPTVKRNGKRFGLQKEEEQNSWLERKLEDGGAKLLGCFIRPLGVQHGKKGNQEESNVQSHLAVLFDGALQVKLEEEFSRTLENGIGSAKGYGFGLISLAPYSP